VATAVDKHSCTHASTWSARFQRSFLLYVYYIAALTPCRMNSPHSWWIFLVLNATSQVRPPYPPPPALVLPEP
jgi:hypothetical protein